MVIYQHHEFKHSNYSIIFFGTIFFSGEIRIHLQRIPVQRDEVQIREIPIEVLQARPNVIRPIQAIRVQTLPEREPQSNYPQRENALLRETFGLTNEDLMNIQRLAQERIEQELKSLAQEELNNESSSSETDEDDSSDESVMHSQQQSEQSKMDNSKRKTDICINVFLFLCLCDPTAVIYKYYCIHNIVEMDAQSQSNAEEKVKSLIAEEDESSDDVQNDQSEKQNT